MQYGKPEISARTRRIASRFEKEVEQGKLRARTHQATDAIIRLAVYKLNRVGEREQARKLLKEWNEQYQFLVLDVRGIGDHKALSLWIAEKYDILEFILGKEVCYTLRLSDLKTINFGIPVVLSCVDNVDEPEYFLHFVHDDNGPFRGPVAAYWTTFFACVGGTWGTGFMYCSPIAMGVEWLAKTVVCPKLNPILWKKACLDK